MRPFKTVSLAVTELPHLGSIFRHFKGGLYKIVGFAWHTDDPHDPLSQLVLYRDVAEPWRALWARPLREFSHEVENDNGVWVRRFTHVETVKDG